MNLSFDDDFYLNRLGTIEFRHDETDYTIVVGYVGNDLYFRLWNAGGFVCGAWINEHSESPNLAFAFNELPSSLKEKCIDIATKMERMKAFL